MSDLYNSNIDHEQYARIGRQMQAREAWSLFSSLTSQIKNTFSGKAHMRGQNDATGSK